MASVFKTFLNNDITSTRTLLHEAIPLTGSLVSGTYGGNTVALGSEPNIKKHTHGMFQSVYDYPYLSSSANHIFDITAGFSSESGFSGSASVTSQHDKKLNMYNQMAQLLMGHDISGSVRPFDADGNLVGGTKINEAFFLNFSRLLSKDEIKKGSFSLELGTYDNFDQTAGTECKNRIKITDISGSNGFFVNSPVGEYGILHAQTGVGSTVRVQGEGMGTATTYPACGLIFYQAGIAVISGSVFNDNAESGILADASQGTVKMLSNSGATGFNVLTASTIDAVADAIRNRIYNISFNNTTELNSSVYFCRASHNEFNYSSNPTYLNGSQIRIKNQAADAPRSYVTTIGLYSPDNELLAVAKLSEPLRKDPTNELTLRVRLDY
jgi:hypothetical protein